MNFQESKIIILDFVHHLTLFKSTAAQDLALMNRARKKNCSIGSKDNANVKPQPDHVHLKTDTELGFNK
jgi:hypothetical protein